MSPLRQSIAALVSVFVVLLAKPVFAAESAPSTSGANGAGGRNGASGIVGEAERFLAAATAGPTAASDPTALGSMPSATAERDVAQSWRATQEPFVSFMPSVSIVARDWRGSTKILGSRTMLVDDLRPTASNRMVMGRIATDGRLSGFVNVGVGEWRIDTVMFPNARSYSEAAGQIGTGFELRLTSRMRLGGEAHYTALYRDLTYTTDEVAPRILAFVLAVDGRF